MSAYIRATRAAIAGRRGSLFQAPTSPLVAALHAALFGRIRAGALRLAGLACVLFVSACATFSPDNGMGVVAGIAGLALNKDIVAIRTGADAEAARATIDKLLQRRLTADAAVQIALLNNRGLQAAYNELAFAEAQMVGEGLPPNPAISLVRIAGSAEIEIERRIVADVLALATLPVRSEIASLRFRQAQLTAALATLRIAAEARRAYYRAVAARESLGALVQAQSSARLVDELAKRLAATGAINKLDRTREQVFYAETAGQVAAARQHAASERESLMRALGLSDDLAFRLPDRLPALPQSVRTVATIEADAIHRRVDLQIARMELDALAKSFGLTQAARFVNVLDAGYADKITKDQQTGAVVRDRGFDIELQVPLFDFGEVRVREAEALYMRAVNRLAEAAVNVRSQARDAYRVYRSTYDIASHYQREVLPLRKIIADETQLRYGAMQIDEFALLAEARQRITATIAAIDAKRDFWLATTDLLTAVVGGGAGSARNDHLRPVIAESVGSGH